MVCAEYPYTDKPEISSRTHSIAAKALECPAVFYIVEQMRARGLKMIAGFPLSPHPLKLDNSERRSHGREVMSKRKKKRKPPAVLRFNVGDRVRVKPGFRDDDHPDIPLGGWAGTVSEVHRSGIYSVHWSRETLVNIHPIYKKRFAIEGKVFDEYWLGDDDLEPDPGGPPSIEQPTAITPRPLSAEEQGDRVRMVFGLTTDDFLPAVDEDSLETYYDFLVERLSLPLEAKYREDEEDFFNPSPSRRVKVVALDREIAWDEDEGVLCVAQRRGRGYCAADGPGTAAHRPELPTRRRLFGLVLRRSARGHGR